MLRTACARSRECRVSPEKFDWLFRGHLIPINMSISLKGGRKTSLKDLCLGIHFRATCKRFEVNTKRDT